MKRLVVIVSAFLVGSITTLGVQQYLASRSTGGQVNWTGPVQSVTQADLGAASQPFNFTLAAKKILPSVVSIDNMRQAGWFEDAVAVGSGSGVVISDRGYIVTNNHVVQDADAVRVHLSDGRSLQARVIGVDPRSDLAVLKVNSSAPLVPAELGSSKNLQVGEWVVAAGSPLGFDSTVSVGVVSSLSRTLPTAQSALTNVIQTDAAINPGNSGGALANYRGQLVGINTAIASTTGVSIGIGFAIPIDRVRQVVDDIVQYGRVRYGALGITVDRRSALLGIPEAREELRELTGTTPPSTGLLVRAVNPGSPAAQAGIERFSVILSVDDTKVKELMDFITATSNRRPGDKVTVEFWTRGQTFKKTITLVDLTTVFGRFQQTSARLETSNYYGNG